VPSVLGPTLYLVVMGVVLGDLVGSGTGDQSLMDGLDYLGFVGPAIVSVTALMTASHEATSPVFHAMRSDRTYAAMAATPLTIPDLVAGHLVWMAVRIAATVSLMTVVVGVLGGLSSPQAVLLVPANIVFGTAVAAAVAAYSARQQIAGALLAWQRFGVVPMILFCGVYFPVEALPGWLGALVRALPLWHGVELSRELAHGTATVRSALPHLAYLGVLGALGARSAVRAFRSRLED
jgi:lipooligosaccharide transport system permease protein